MRSFANPDVRPAMVPWIIVLAILFGANAFATQAGPDGKEGSPQEATLSQAGDEAPPATRSSAPLGKVPALSTSDSRLAGPGCTLLPVDDSRGHPIRPSRPGVARGRAPPAAV